MFDPEKVRRHDTDFPDENGRWFQATCVEAEDYDQLLEIHRRHVDMIADLFSRCGEPLSEEKLAALKNGTWR